MDSFYILSNINYLLIYEMVDGSYLLSTSDQPFIKCYLVHQWINISSLWNPLVVYLLCVTTGSSGNRTVVKEDEPREIERKCPLLISFVDSYFLSFTSLFHLFSVESKSRSQRFHLHGTEINSKEGVRRKETKKIWKEHVSFPTPWTSSS